MTCLSTLHLFCIIRAFETLQRYSPLLVGVIGIGTIVACMIISRVRGDYTGGLVWPYISDTGRDKPQYYLFAVGQSPSHMRDVMD